MAFGTQALWVLLPGLFLLLLNCLIDLSQRRLQDPEASIPEKAGNYACSGKLLTISSDVESAPLLPDRPALHCN
jgi:hypothetical protein